MSKQGMRLESRGGWSQMQGALNAPLRSAAVTGGEGVTLAGHIGGGEEQAG